MVINQTYESLVAGLGRPFNTKEKETIAQVKLKFGNSGMAHYVTHYLILLNDLKLKGEDVSDERHLDNFRYLWDKKAQILQEKQNIERAKQLNETMGYSNLML